MGNSGPHDWPKRAWARWPPPVAQTGTPIAGDVTRAIAAPMLSARHVKPTNGLARFAEPWAQALETGAAARKRGLATPPT